MCWRSTIVVLMLMMKMKPEVRSLSTDLGFITPSMEAEDRSTFIIRDRCSRFRRRSFLGIELGCRSGGMLKSPSTRSPSIQKLGISNPTKDLEIETKDLNQIHSLHPQNIKPSSSLHQEFKSKSETNSKDWNSRFSKLKSKQTKVKNQVKDESINKIKHQPEPTKTQDLISSTSIPQPQLKPFQIYLKNLQTLSHQFISEIKKTFSEIVIHHGEPELDNTRDKFIDFFEKVWEWIKSIPKSYKLVFGHQPIPENMSLEEASKLESQEYTSKESKRLINRYLKTVKDSVQEPEMETLRKKMIEYVKVSPAIRFINLEHGLINLIPPSQTRTHLMMTLLENIKDQDESLRARLDSALVIRFIESFGNSLFAKLSFLDLLDRFKSQSGPSHSFSNALRDVIAECAYIDRLIQIDHQQRALELLSQKSSSSSQIQSIRKPIEFSFIESPLPDWIPERSSRSSLK